MGDVLARIIERKRRDVAAAAPISHTPPPTRRSLRAALAQPGARFLMEVKSRSPSGHRARHPVGRAVDAYAGIADAISVLTDGPDFGGSLDDLRFARARFDGPILAKDFFVDPLQVDEARAAGADAVLVMMSVLADKEAAAILAAARRLGMDALVEVHDEGELARALALGASLIGINNRDLRTLSIDLSVTERLAPLVPENVTLITESGIATRADVLRLAPLVDGFLVGSSLMAAANIDEAARALVHGRVKLCGLTRVEDVALAARSGATHAGFLFHPASPRRLTVDQARPLVSAARNARLATVGVFDGADSSIAATARDLGLDAVQVHGQIADRLKAALGQTALIGVCAIRNGIVDPAPAGTDRLLFDHGDGGSGHPFDWALVAGHPARASAFLAGGIGPANAAAASRVGAYALDLSSGIEIAPGCKDPAKVRALFDALRPTARGAR